MSRLVVVSNRVAPVKRAGSGSEGGLAVAVRAAMQDRGGIWFGWSGKVQEKETVGPDIFEVGKLTYAVLDLSQRDYEEYYNGYANRTLWPLFHYRLDLAEFHRRYVAGYYRVNALFASKLLPLLEPDDMIWVHDYHLIPIADLLRQAGCRNRIGFFLHIPWPTPEVFTALPNERNLVNALCAYDLVGFQTESDLRAFHDYIELEAGGIVHRDGTVEAYGRSVQAGAFPISIDTADVARMAEAEVRSRQSQRLRDSLKGRELMIGVDRLDYSKGLVTRIEAIELLLRDYPDSRTRVVTLQITPPSRTDVPEYLEIRRELEWVVGRVNGTYADFDWVPVRYLNKGFRRQTLTGFYRLSRVGLVTPLRDGMNLVAKEYVAAQDPKDPGVLILSRFAGAAQELNGALTVNPYDIEAMAEAMHRALSMRRTERRERWQAMWRWLERNDLDAWQRHFLETLADLKATAAA